MSAPPVGPPSHVLSHPLSEGTPAYGGGTGFVREPLSSIANGDTANSEVWRMPNHLGTHIDMPRHFFESGAAVDTLTPQSLWFSSPALVDAPVGLDGLIYPIHLESHLDETTDIILIRTGTEILRDSETYWMSNPGLTADLGLSLRARWPNVRAVAIDCVSITARAHRSTGREAHRAFLNPEGDGSPILIIEDAKLGVAPRSLRALCVVPIFVSATDGAPCTILAWSGDGVD